MSESKNNIEQTPSHCKIYVIPNLITAGNLFFGFLAIIRCIQAKYTAGSEIEATAFYTQAVWFIILAFICDMMDGRIARLAGKESLFGKEFDSLADIISFGVAPSLMLFFLILSPTEGYPVFRQIGWLIGFIYLLCAAVRLARFNVITHPLLPEKDRYPSSSDFMGLPVPAAAAMIASLVLVLTRLESRLIWLAMPGLMLLIAFLMVSSIPYPSFKNIDWQTHTPLKTFLMVVILVATLFIFKEFAFALIFVSYIFYGLLRYLRIKWQKKSFENE